jgi:hypothetical protein
MKRKLKVKADHHNGAERIVERYAWFPKSLDDDYQVWLETYYVRQIYYIWDRRGRWCNDKTWSERTEKRRFLNSIKDSEKNVQDGMGTQKYTRAIQAAERTLRKRNSTYQ